MHSDCQAIRNLQYKIKDMIEQQGKAICLLKTIESSQAFKSTTGSGKWSKIRNEDGTDTYYADMMTASQFFSVDFSNQARFCNFGRADLC